LLINHRSSPSRISFDYQTILNCYVAVLRFATSKQVLRRLQQLVIEGCALLKSSELIGSGYCIQRIYSARLLKPIPDGEFQQDQAD